MFIIISQTGYYLPLWAIAATRASVGCPAASATPAYPHPRSPVSAAGPLHQPGVLHCSIALVDNWSSRFPRFGCTLPACWPVTFSPCVQHAGCSDYLLTCSTASPSQAGQGSGAIQNRFFFVKSSGDSPQIATPSCCSLPGVLFQRPFEVCRTRRYK